MNEIEEETLDQSSRRLVDAIMEECITIPLFDTLAEIDKIACLDEVVKAHEQTKQRPSIPDLGHAKIYAREGNVETPLVIVRATDVVSGRDFAEMNALFASLASELNDLRSRVTALEGLNDGTTRLKEKQEYLKRLKLSLAQIDELVEDLSVGDTE